MKTLVLANQKGGVGKSAVAVQLAYYLHLQAGYRVLVIDFDHQRNTTKTLKTGGIITVSDVMASDVLNEQKVIPTPGEEDVSANDFLLLSADNESLMKMERQADKHNLFATNLHGFLAAHNDQFDVCIIDTNPNPDIRQLASLVVADYVLSPIQFHVLACWLRLTLNHLPSRTIAPLAEHSVCCPRCIALLNGYLVE